MHDYGWDCLEIRQVNNGWIDRVEFKDFNQNLRIRTSSAVTVSNMRVTGKKAHTSVSVTQSYGILVKDSVDTAGHHHGAGVAQRNSGAVFLRYNLVDGQRTDSHGSNPIATLYDNVSNGHFFGNGGDIRSLPNHLGHWVGWNFRVGGGADRYDFWVTDRNNRNVFLRPFFAGLHGKDIDIVRSSVAANESQGRRVEPESLFEAQLGLRLLPGYKLCCEEGTQKRFDSRVDIAYGALGKYNFIYNVRGNVTFNNQTFGGDPIKGQKKSVYYRPAGPRGYFKDADEGDEVVVRSLRNVRFGANGQYETKFNRRSNIDCTREAFGGDPAPGVRKACYIQTLQTPNGYDFAAREGSRVDVRGTMNIAFGANGQYVWLNNQTSDVTCNRQTFGGDPLPGVAKSCYVRSVGN